MISSCSLFTANNSKPSVCTTAADTQQEIIPEGNSYFNFIVSEIEAFKKNNQKSFEYLIKAQQKDPESKYLKKQLAAKLLIYKKTEAAQELITDLIDKNPEDPEILALFAGLLALENKDPAQIIEIYKKILELEPENKKAPIALAFLYEKLNNRSELIETFEKAEKKSKHNYFLYFYLGEAYLLEKKFNEARKTLYRAAKEEPYRIEPKLSLIETIKNLENSQEHKKEIIDLFNEIIELKPNDSTPLIELSYFYYQNGDYEKSDETFRTAAEDWADDKQRIAALLNFYVINNASDKADFTAIRIFQATGDDMVFMILGNIYSKAHKNNKAIETYMLVPENSELHSNSLAAAALTLNESGRPKEAVSLIKKNLEQKPGDLILISTLGNLYEEKQDYKNAEIIYLQGASIESDKKWSFHYRLGVISDKAGKREKAIEHMKQALELSPENPDALNYLGYTYAEMGINLETAKEMIEKALLARKNDGYITDSLGWVYFKMGDYEKAEFYLEKAAEIVKNDPVILEHLGDLYLKTGREEKAAETYKKVLDANPDNADVKKKFLELEKQ
ncbi:MAG: tetratricopeptide repeat protein [Desulfobacteraceae bacterium]|nr:tetratricopeptide repeat protein [Desulfobacteraceae bacterium]MCB9494633.1 tetratricopeptide repeat protein [Desulfobacteraceae bacterium]